MTSVFEHDFDANNKQLDNKKTIDDILKEASRYLKDQKNIDIIKHAYEVAVKKHEGQFRRSGDPYVQHPIEVAYILATMNTGPATIAAGWLHNVLEDTDMTKEQMEKEFGALKIADGAIVIDSTEMSIEEVYEKVVEIITNTELDSTDDDENITVKINNEEQE